MTHTKEPWSVRDCICGEDCGYYDVISGPGEMISFTKEDARRIVACVNACQGIPTEELEKGLSSLRAAITLLDAARSVLARLSQETER